MRYFLLILVTLLLFGCTAETYIQSKIPASGTFASIKIPNISGADNRILKISDFLDKQETVFSRFNDNGALSNINERLKAAEVVSLDGDMLKLWNAAVYLNDISDGAFDVTVSELMDEWGLYKKQSRKIPDTDKLQHILNRTGQDKLLFDPDQNTLSAKTTGITLDFNSIAKGLIVDNAVSYARGLGIDSGMIELGGDLYCLGNKNGHPWKIGIQDPLQKNKYIGALELENMACATSGTYENFLMIDGVRYSHMIDPRTGSPALNSVISATVIADTCMMADGLATILCILDEDQGMELISKIPNAECIIVEQKGNMLLTHKSKNISKFLRRHE